MKKALCVLLALCMMTSLVIPAAATEIEGSVEEEKAVATNIKLRENENVVCVDTLPNGNESVITSYDKADGTIEYSYYENENLIRTYTVAPGSGYYTVKENTGENGLVAKRAIEKTVYVGTATNEKAAAISESGYKYWGSVSYYNPFMNETYTIRCTILEDVDTDGRFSPAAYYAEKASFLVSVVSFFFFPTKDPIERAAEKIFDEAVERAFFVKVVSSAGEVLKYVLEKNFSVDATYISYRIKGVGITGHPSGEFESRDGYKATVAASDGLFNKTTYTAIWTKDDWRNPTMGRLMFWEVYGNEYSPTSWNP